MLMAVTHLCWEANTCHKQVQVLAQNNACLQIFIKIKIKTSALGVTFPEGKLISESVGTGGAKLSNICLIFGSGFGAKIQFYFKG